MGGIALLGSFFFFFFFLSLSFFLSVFLPFFLSALSVRSIASYGELGW